MLRRTGTHRFRVLKFLLEALAPAKFLPYFKLRVLALAGTDC
jgi:hypothetical protein